MVMEKSAKSGHSYGFGAKTERFTSQSLSPDKSKMSPFTIFIVTAIEVRSEKKSRNNFEIAAQMSRFIEMVKSKWLSAVYPVGMLAKTLSLQKWQ